MEVRAREAEHDRGLVLVGEDGVHRDAPVAIQEGDDERKCPVSAAHAPDEVGPLAPEEDGPEHLEGIEERRPPGLRERRVELRRAERGIAREVLPARRERDRRERPLEDGPCPGAPVERNEERGRRVERERRGLGRDELGAGIHAHRVEDPAGSRVEEGLGKLEILPVSGEAREECLHRRPQRDIRDALAEERLEIPDRGVEPVAIELEALEGIGPRPVPVALRKARGRPARDLAERARVLLVRAKQPLGAGLGALLAHRRTTAALRPGLLHGAES